MMHFTSPVLVAAALSLLLAACGVRGGLEYPKEDAIQTGSVASAETGQGKPEGAAGKKHKPFLLDGLLR